MRIEERKILLKNGETAILRSPQKEDAQQMIDYMRATSGETHKGLCTVWLEIIQ